MKAPDSNLKWMERNVTYGRLNMGRDGSPVNLTHSNRTPSTGPPWRFDPLPRPLFQPSPDFGADYGEIGRAHV